MKETDIQRAILDYLAIKRIFHYRQNSGAFKTERGGFYRMGVTGAPDIICVINGQYVGLEIKKPKGKQSDGQRVFQQNLEAAGGKYFLIYSLDEAIVALAQLTK